MAPRKKNPTEPQVTQALNEYINAVTIAKATQQEFVPQQLEDVFRGKEFASFRDAIRKDGVAPFTTSDGTSYVGVDIDELGRVMATAATIPRTPSKAQDFLKQVADFTNQSVDRATEIQLFRNIGSREGIINNAINKIVALVATNGSFKVRRIKGVRGKGGDKRADEYLTLLKYWVENVNSPAEDGVVTGGRGIKAFISQGSRQTYIEGDLFSRTIWSKTKVPVLKGASFSLPMNIQTFAGDVIDIPLDAQALNLEWIDWVPPKSILNSLTNPRYPEMKEELNKLVPPDVQAELKKRNGRYRLEPGLMAHIKHRGTMSSAFGESFIRAAMASIAYKRALMALDIVTIENLLNRLLIIKIGSDDPNSVYHKQEVSARRVKLLQNMIAKAGPHATLLWAGPDIDVKEAGAYGKILEMDGRYSTADTMLRADMGTPSALLTGEGTSGKSSAIAAIIAVAAQIQEVQDQFAQTLRTWAQRIGEANGFEDVDVTWEFAPNPLIDKTETVNTMLKGYAQGILPLKYVIEEGFGADYDSIVEMMNDEVSDGFRDEPFGIPKALVQQAAGANPGGTTTNPSGTGNGGGGDGRPTNTGNPDPRRNKDTGSPTENK
jgi:hypothetical protein